MKYSNKTDWAEVVFFGGLMLCVLAGIIGFTCYALIKPGCVQ